MRRNPSRARLAVPAGDIFFIVLCSAAPWGPRH